mmetsp:Transcript_29307/g.93495  ORF Transcript_29307/g.93495 Transcript_29307/m.93495 type:complete len:110 (-) Transcript_29307:74-403(-)
MAHSQCSSVRPRALALLAIGVIAVTALAWWGNSLLACLAGGPEPPAPPGAEAPGELGDGPKEQAFSYGSEAALEDAATVGSFVFGYFALKFVRRAADPVSAYLAPDERH